MRRMMAMQEHGWNGRWQLQPEVPLHPHLCVRLRWLGYIGASAHRNGMGAVVVHFLSEFGCEFYVYFFAGAVAAQ